MQSNRRDFIKGCAAAAIAAGTTPALAWFDPTALRGQKTAANGDVIVYLFLPGGLDSLHMVVPYSGPDRTIYETKRGANLVIPVGNLRRIGNTAWGWHPRAGGDRGAGVGSTPRWLQKLYIQNRLAIVHATGMPSPNRSHFDAQRMIELGTPGNPGTTRGWLTRYLSAATGLPQPTIAPVYGFGSTLPTSILGTNEAVGFNRAEQFRVDGFHWPWNETRHGRPQHPINGHYGAHSYIRSFWNGGTSRLEQAGRDAADALEYMRTIEFRPRTPQVPDGYLPSGGAEYPNTTLGAQLRNLAQMLKTPLRNGLVAAALSSGGWDTHESQGMPQPGNPNHYDSFGGQLEDLAKALDAFYTDLQATSAGSGATLMDKVTIIVQSEFGRRFRANDSNGTDHGYGGVMMAIGNKVNGGQLHGTFPGLDDASLRDGQDVDVTTDYRQILSEALVKRMGLPASRIPQVFPGFSYGNSAVFMS